ncbi:MAG TPA: hypothetical protein DF774_10395 [Rheinheimera sp.]|uniref:hypothetical protein n=1 Tax=Rheinheimera sp. TaxID=1869214 RepID=UPI000EBFD2A3|nr:hypothetical protein [Rheinheimera sp.]HCU66156.1 hypothetical protein [Rheinheimera sp.]
MIQYIEKGYGLHQMLAAQGIELRNVDGVWIANAPDDQVNQLIADYNPWPPEKATKFAEIDQAFESAVSSLTAGWPQHEIQTWNKQEAEARALVAKPDAPTPMLSTIAATRGLTVPELAQRVIRDADAFTAASANFVGLRHKARQLVQALPDAGDYQRLAELFDIKFGG